MRRTIPDGVQTTGNTPTVAFSVSIAENSAVYVMCKFVYSTTTKSNAGWAVAEAAFRRPTGGNVTRSSGSGGASAAQQRAQTDFTGALPTVDIVANTSTQTADIVITGKAATTIDWIFENVSLRNI